MKTFVSTTARSIGVTIAPHAVSILGDHPYRGAGPSRGRLAIIAAMAGERADASAEDSVGARLRDGAPVHLRPIRPDDKERLLDAFGRLSQDTVYYRFLEPKKRLTPDDLRYLTELDFEHHAALVATVAGESGEEIVGVGRFVEEERERRPRTAEAAFTVVDHFQGRGLGTLLLQHLGELARRCGFERFEAWVLGDNRRMLEVFEHSGFEVHERVESGLVHVFLDLTREAGPVERRKRSSPPGPFRF